MMGGDRIMCDSQKTAKSLDENTYPDSSLSLLSIPHVCRLCPHRTQLHAQKMRLKPRMQPSSSSSSSSIVLDDTWKCGLVLLLTFTFHALHAHLVRARGGVSSIRQRTVMMTHQQILLSITPTHPRTN
ncbi:hypothetical protein C0Q70_05954 [Pomacea canaliculata]|uniref:Uncharacterized protein n=1 Tax=Pomacea canaliculata TaxID=400727 RepID=A0A2T7PMS2_POMCA|nr:hypothetical protein C0Q70_05954 [Pomacea canaliculata]